MLKNNGVTPSCKETSMTPPWLRVMVDRQVNEEVLLTAAGQDSGLIARADHTVRFLSIETLLPATKNNGMFQLCLS